jgi:hypothetical protein
MPSTEPVGQGLAHERTALAWNRSGLAVVVCTAVLLRHLWPLRSADEYVALGGAAAAAIIWAAALLAFTVSRAYQAHRVPQAARVFALMTVGTVMLAVVASVLAFVGPP